MILQFDTLTIVAGGFKARDSGKSTLVQQLPNQVDRPTCYVPVDEPGSKRERLTGDPTTKIRTYCSSSGDQRLKSGLLTLARSTNLAQARCSAKNTTAEVASLNPDALKGPKCPVFNGSVNSAHQSSAFHSFPQHATTPKTRSRTAKGRTGNDREPVHGEAFQPIEQVTKCVPRQNPLFGKGGRMRPISKSEFTAIGDVIGIRGEPNRPINIGRLIWQDALTAQSTPRAFGSGTGSAPQQIWISTGSTRRTWSR